MTTFLKTRIGAVQQKQDKRPGTPNFRLWSIRHHDNWEKVGPAARADAYNEHVSSKERHALEEVSSYFNEPED